MARIAGVKSLHIIPITDANATSSDIAEYGTLEEVKQFISFSGSLNRAESAWYSNNRTEESFSSITGAELEAVVGKLSPAQKAKISGATYSTGVMTRKATDRQAEFGVLVVYELMGTGGGQYAELYCRTKLAIDTIEGETKTDSITDSPVTISGIASPLPGGQVVVGYEDTGLTLKTPAELFAEMKKIALT